MSLPNKRMKSEKDNMFPFEELKTEIKEEGYKKKEAYKKLMREIKLQEEEYLEDLNKEEKEEHYKEVEIKA